MAGRDDDDMPFVMYHWAWAIGAGAVDGRDGFNANGGLMALGALYLPDLERYEQSYPVRFLRQSFRLDGGGAGKYRGGTGIDYAVEVEKPAVLSLRGEGLNTPSGFGIGGGGTGRAGRMRIVLDDGEEIVPDKYGILEVGPMTLELEAAGGGGWGDPLDRDPDLVLRDVRDGTVGDAIASDVYGIVFKEDFRSVDGPATAALRARLRAAR